MTTIRELHVGLPHEVGSLHALCSVLSGQGVNILGFGLDVPGPMGFLRLVVDRPDAAAFALRNRDYQVFENEVQAVALPHERGSFGRLAAAYAGIGESIQYCYCLIGLVPHPDTGEDLAVVAVTSLDPQRAAEALQADGLSLLGSEDIGQEPRGS